MKNARCFIKQRAFFLTGCPARERDLQLHSYQRIAFCRRAESGLGVTTGIADDDGRGRLLPFDILV
jgi:hypothetical protein